MLRQSTIKQPSKSLLTSPSLQNLVVDLEPQHEESISGGYIGPVIILFLAQSSKTQPGKYDDVSIGTMQTTFTF